MHRDGPRKFSGGKFLEVFSIKLHGKSIFIAHFRSSLLCYYGFSFQKFDVKKPHISPVQLDRKYLQITQEAWLRSFNLGL